MVKVCVAVVCVEGSFSQMRSRILTVAYNNNQYHTEVRTSAHVCHSNEYKGYYGVQLDIILLPCSLCFDFLVLLLLLVLFAAPFTFLVV